MDVGYSLLYSLIADAVVCPTRGVPPCASNPSRCRFTLQFDTVAGRVKASRPIPTASIAGQDAWTALHCSSPHYLLASPFVEENGETRANPSQWRLAGRGLSRSGDGVCHLEVSSAWTVFNQSTHASVPTLPLSVMDRHDDSRRDSAVDNASQALVMLLEPSVSLYSTIWKAPAPAWDAVARVTRTPSACEARMDDPRRPIGALSRADHTTPVPP